MDMEAIQGIGGILLGFSVFRIFSFPESNLNKRLPQIKLLFIEFFPRLKLRMINYKLWIHHWMFLSIIFVALLATSSFTQLLLVKSLCLGGIIQGFTYKDRFHIISKS